MARVNPATTRWHLVELALNGIIILFHVVEFGVAIEKGDGGFFAMGAVFLALAWAASLSTTYHEYRRGVKHAWPLIVWQVGAFVLQSLKLQAMLATAVFLSRTIRAMAIVHFIFYGILGVATFVYNVDPPSAPTDAFVDLMGREDSANDSKAVPLEPLEVDIWAGQSPPPKIPVVYGAYPESKNSPEEDGGTIGGIIYSWMNPLLDLASRRPLEAEDLPKLSKVDETAGIVDRLQANWEAQVRSGTNSFFRALLSSFGAPFCFAGLLKIVNDACAFMGPILLGLIIQFIQNPAEPLWHGIMYAFLMGLASIVQSLFIHMYFFRVFRVGQQIRASIAGLVYRKAFSMSFDARKKYTVGEMVNHQAVDTARLDGTMPYLHMIWSGPVQIIVSLALLYRIVGASVFAGLAVLILMIPVNVQISRMLSVIQKNMMTYKDARNKIINEVLQGIRVIKYFAWEKSYEEKVGEARAVEIEAMRSGAKIKAYTSFLWVASPVIVSLATFGVFTALGHKLTPEIAFPALALINILRFPINALPNVISSIVDSQVSISRLQAYFLSYDLDSGAVEQDLNEPCAVKISDGEFEWVMYRPVLETINISIQPGQLVAVVGEVGCGKSSFLSALLGEIPKTRGKVVVNGRLAYCPQQAWIQNTSLRDNVTFGAPFRADWYQKVVDLCELRSDIAILQAGDMTEIGEKGINLSGGQKQRVSLARAVYQQADVYLLDDPLSAVDAHVGKALFENCILNHLHGKTRILVTHQLQYLSKVDHIIVMTAGRISEQGTYDKLMADGGEFSKLIMNHVHDPVPTTTENDDEKDHADDLDDMSEEDYGCPDELDDDSTTSPTPPPRARPKKRRHGDTSPRTSQTEAANLVADPGSVSSSDVDQTIGEMGDDADPNGRRSRLESEVVRVSLEKRILEEKLMKEGPPASTNATTEDKGKLMSTEERSTGSVGSDVYFTYAKAIGGIIFSGIVLLFFVLDSGSKIASDFWLTVWSAAASIVPPPHSMSWYLGIYALIALSNSVAIMFRSFLLIYGAMRAAVTIHREMLHAVMRSPVSWFDTVPLGRILNRFAKDQYAVDESLMRTLSMALGTLFGVISIAIVVGAVTPWILIYVLPLAFLYRYIQQYYLNSSRELQRLSGISRSPIFALFSESLSGLSTIRGYGKASEFIRTNELKIDENQKAHFLSTTANRWLGLRLEFVGTCVVFGAALFAVFSRNSLAAGLVGLSITYALQLTSQLNWMVRMSTDVENELVSVERCVQYTQLEPEAALIVEPRPAASWPPHGAITFNNLSLRYRDGLPLVLRNISLQIRAREKIGVVGRTGAGKSSLMNALFRMTEASSGNILIDDIDISTIGLEDLRSRLAIIPQDPTLFAGTVRSNLDPFGSYTDAAIWTALEKVYLKEQVEAMGRGLDSAITEFGENLSVGSRQLMCLARAVIRNPRILVMDEATASIDYKSDEKIQRTIREQFKDATVLTIAHRIATIADSDRVMVLDFGKLVEFDTPENLMKNPNSIYCALARKSKQSRKEAKAASKAAASASRS